MATKLSDIPPIGITMGCPASIGPEIIIKYLAEHGSLTPPVIIGDGGILERTAFQLGIATTIRPWSPGEKTRPGYLNLLECSSLDPPSIVAGEPTRETGTAMAAYIDTAIARCSDGNLSGMTTCPISKSTLNEAGFFFPGHTEMLAERTGAERVAMMLAGSRLRVVPVTIHCSIAAVPSTLTRDAIVATTTLTNIALRNDFALDSPRVAVAALNPHAGENGLFGNEERSVISPAIEDCRRAGIDANGPYPPDTVFHHAASGRYDAVICMYHDQGLIPFKLMHFDDGVNITIGLPIIRTSVDHGTAYDIAGKGVAGYSSLKNAVELAARFALNRRNREKGNQR